MVTHNFRNGNPIGFDPTTNFEPIETAYQTRGHAKYVDIADIFGGWQALGDIYEVFYREDLASGTPPNTQVGVSHDEFLLKGSQALQCNLASLFHFWGIHPSTSAAVELQQYPACDGAKERILNYLNAAPRTNEELQLFHRQKTLLGENQLKFQIYDQLLPAFDESYGQQIRSMGARILATYFDVTPDTAPSTPSVNVAHFNFDPTRTDYNHFSWSESVDPEGQALSYSWVLMRADTNEVLLSRSWVTGTSVSIPRVDVLQALQPLMNSSEDIPLIQRVTTSDTFSVVQSSDTQTRYSFLPDNDGDGLSNEQEISLGLNPDNPDTDGDGLSDGEEVLIHDNQQSPTPTPEPTSDSSDLTGDGISDILWRNDVTGALTVWSGSANGVNYLSSLPRVSDTAWQVISKGKFDGDNDTDLLWYNNQNGRVVIWKMSGTELISRIDLPTVRNLDWFIAGTGDLDGNGVDDIVWRNKTSGNNTLWLLSQDATVINSVLPTVKNTQWRVALVTDMNKDGNADILWRNQTSGDNTLWIMNGATQQQNLGLDKVSNTSWHIAGGGDFDGDGNPDLLWRNLSDGQNVIWLMEQGIRRSNVNLSTVRNLDWQIADTGDFDNNGVTDIMWRNQNTGSNTVWYFDQQGFNRNESLTTVANTDWNPVN